MSKACAGKEILIMNLLHDNCISKIKHLEKNIKDKYIKYKIFFVKIYIVCGAELLLSLTYKIHINWQC